jgi:signal transduction histidine kinase
LRELLLNLVDNAVKYSQEGQTVELALGLEGNQAKLVVQDHGIGIAPENHTRVFDRFYRTDEARAHGAKGTGLGLAICKWIVDVHHGTIELASTVHGGSCFTVFLPLSSVTV